jgi:multidrug efflux pump subunit AcrA (membrane-fusion protein)
MKIHTRILLRRSVLRGAAVAALVAPMCGIGGCGRAEKETEPVVSVETTPARRGPIAQIVSAEAVVFPLEQAVLTPKITSTIGKFLVERGSRVHKGQLLAILENADLSAAAEQSKGEFEQAEAGYATTTGASLPQQIQKAELDAAAAKVALDAQQNVYASRKELFKKGAIPRKDLDSSEVALAQARTQSEVAQRQLDDLKRLGEQQALKSAGGQLAAARGKYLGARAQLSYSEIRSPIDGVVTDRPLYPGELAAANQPLLTVMNMSRLIAKMHIAQLEASGLAVGHPAELKLPALDAPVTGRVSLVSPALDPGSTTIEVWVDVSKPSPSLRPGMTVEVSMTAKTVADAIVVPASSIFKDAQQADYVLTAGADARAHLKNVKIGVLGEGLAQILSGINPGEAVISSGGYALPDNTKIKIAPPAPAEKGSDAQDSAKPSAGHKD